MAQLWHSDHEILEKLREYSRASARFPLAINDARSNLSDLAVRMRSSLRNLKPDIYTKLIIEFTGSSYEGLKIPGDLEFDLLLVMRASKIEKMDVFGKPGFVKLKPQTDVYRRCVEAEYQDISAKGNELESNGYILASKWSARFFGDLQLCINEDPVSFGNVRYSVDMVPCFEFPSVDERYVPKASDDNTVLWRRSFSLEEKAILSTIDSPFAGNTCRKECLRILKAFRKQEATFRGITSYHLKTTLLHLNEQEGATELWRPDKLMVRVMKLLEMLESFLKQGNMPNFFLREVNLLNDISEITCANIYTRIAELRRSKAYFERFIEFREKPPLYATTRATGCAVEDSDFNLNPDFTDNEETGNNTGNQCIIL